MATIKINATDGSGSFDAYLVEPKHKPAGAVVLIQEIFGVNQSMRDTAEQVADLGFFVLAPDLFWRIEPGVDITDKSKEEWDKAFALMNAFDGAKGIEDLNATLAAARVLPGCNGRAGTMGYCLGGRLAFAMAAHSDADINISYYGVGLDSMIADIPAITSPLLVHIADEDGFFPPEGRAKLVEAAKANSKIATYVYSRKPITRSPASAAPTGMAAPPGSPTAAPPRRWRRCWGETVSQEGWAFLASSMIA